MASQELIHGVKQNVIDKFTDLKSALMMREKLLLRQLEVINTTSKQQMQQQQEDAEKLTPNIEFFSDNEQELLAAIRNYGRYQLTNLNLALQDIYLKNEDYIKPTDDHETMFKGLNQECIADGAEDHNESIVVDFSHHKTLMEHNAKLMNDSIINITLKEAKELIKQAKMKKQTPVPPLNLEELDDEVESSIAEVVSSLEASSDHFSNNKYCQTSKQKRFKPKITINNCNGTINLRNIASLTINCSTEENIQAQIPVRYAQEQEENGNGNGDGDGADAEEPSTSTKSKDKSTTKSKTLVESLVSSSTNTECTSPTSTSQTTTPNSMSNYSSNNSSRSQSKKQKSKKSQTKSEKPQLENKPLSTKSTSHEYPVVESSSSNDVTCDFYNRLLDEIKRSINQQQKTRTKCSSATESHHQAAAAAADSTSYSQSSSYSDYMSENPNSRRLVLKNFENLKIILEANSSGDEESFHPVQIEQWLAEIISETDLEPMQNTDILEHSKIHNESQET